MPLLFSTHHIRLSSQTWETLSLWPAGTCYVWELWVAPSPQPAKEWDLGVRTPRRCILPPATPTWDCIFSNCLWPHNPGWPEWRGARKPLRPGLLAELWDDQCMLYSLCVDSNLLCSDKNEYKGLYAKAEARQLKSHLIFTGPIWLRPILDPVL